MDAREPLRRVRASIERRPAQLRSRWWPLLQVAIAAGLAWLVANLLPGHEAGIFAPITAAIALGAGPGQRGSQAVQLIAGVALGILVGDVVILAFGGGTWQLALAVALALLAATGLGLSEFVALQAGISALIVVALEPAELFLVPDRLVDAAIGGAVALAFSQVLFPADPVRLAAQATDPALRELAGCFERLSCALRERDEDGAQDALAALQRIDDRRLRDALSTARTTAQRAPRRRAERSRLRAYERIADELDTTGRDAAVLAMGSIRLIRSGDAAAEAFAEAVDLLGDAVLALVESLDADGGAIRADRAALVAARRAHVALGEREGMTADLLRNQVDSLARDVLRSCGAGDDEATEAVRKARAGAREEAGVSRRPG